MSVLRKTVKKHWYLISTYECPVCGGGNTYRERMYTPKPKDPSKRYHWVQQYDWCNEF